MDATSPVLFKRSKNNPILLPEKTNEWEAQGAFNGCPVKMGDTVKLLYRALSFPQSFEGHQMEVSRIGIATFDKKGVLTSRTLCISPEEPWEKYGCEDPRVTYFENNYYICYTGLSTYPFNPAGIKVAMAKTTDFTSIERHLVTPFNAKAMAIFPERVNGKVAAILTVDSDIPPSSICVALADSVSDYWSYEYWDRWYTYKQRNTLPLLRSLADHIEVGCPPLKTAEGWLVIYSYISAYLTNTKIFAVEAILLDSDNPLEIKARLPFSLLQPEAAYEKKGVIDNIVFPTGLLLDGDILSLYYGGADRVCAVATCSLKDLLSALKNHPYN